MSKPRLLYVFDSSPTDIAYSKLSNYVKVTRSGEYIVVSSCTEIQDGATLVFTAPCDCSLVKGIKVNNRNYLFKDAHGHNVEKLKNLFSQGALVSVRLSGYSAFIQNADTNKYIEDNFFKLKRTEYLATPSNVLSVIKNAQPGSTVQLTAGTYPLITLSGVDSFPENLTIKGGSGVEVAGILITSGIMHSDIYFNTDTSSTVMSSNLTLEGLRLTNSISLRNASFDGLTIDNCTITDGCISIAPTRFKDFYGQDSNGAAIRYSIQKTYGRNVVIKNCLLQKSTGTNTMSKTAIYVQSCENITIHNNTILSAATSVYILGDSGAIQYAYPSGEIRISSNIVRDNTSIAFKIESLRHSKLHAVSNQIDKCGNTTRVFQIQNCLDTVYEFCRTPANEDGTGGDGYNNYGTEDNAKTIDKGSGIYVTNVNSYVQSNQVPVGNIRQDTYDYSANKDNLAEVLASAHEGSTIKLASGTYDLLTIQGHNAIAKNITLVGSNKSKVNIAGVFITSGQTNADLFKNSDTIGAIVTSGLTFRSITFTAPFHLRNCRLDNLLVEDCDFINGANIWLDPSRLKGQYYGSENSVDDATRSDTRWTYCTVRIKNPIIRNCKFTNSTDAAIYARSVDGALIYGNTIKGAGGNGIQVSGLYRGTNGDKMCYSIGDIYIGENTIDSTNTLGINLNNIEGAHAYICYNTLTNVNLNPGEGYEYLNYQILTLHDSLSEVYILGNRYHNKSISVGDTGICKIVNTYNLDASQLKGGLRKSIQRSGDWLVAIGDGYKECWGTFSGEVSVENNTIYFTLPFEISEYDMMNLQITTSAVPYSDYGLYLEDDVVIGIDVIFAVPESEIGEIHTTAEIYCMSSVLEEV